MSDKPTDPKPQPEQPGESPSNPDHPASSVQPPDESLKMPASEADALSRDTGSGTPKKTWPLSWILIIILVYIAAQTAYLAFFAD